MQGRSSRPKLFTVQVLVKLSPSILDSLDYVVSNYVSSSGKKFKGRSTFIREATIKFLASKLTELKEAS
jgi:metal-responsive CopG/Arc/MetJ family transcriptional regulator